jgi:5'-nucleotidase
MDGTAAAAPDVRTVTTDSIPPDPQVDSLARRALAAVAPLIGKKIATFATMFRRTGSEQALGNLVTDAQRAAGNADVAATNVSGLRADVHSGVATWGTLYQVHPFGNTLVRSRSREHSSRRGSRSRPRRGSRGSSSAARPSCTTRRARPDNGS